MCERRDRLVPKQVEHNGQSVLADVTEQIDISVAAQHVMVGMDVEDVSEGTALDQRLSLRTPGRRREACAP